MAVEALEDATATEELAGETVLLGLLLLRYNAYLRRRAVLRLEELRGEILRELATVDLAGPQRYAQAARLDAPMTALIQGAYDEIDADLRRELVGLVGLVSDFTADRIDAAIGRQDIGRRLAPQVERLLPANAMIEGATIASWLGSQAGNLLFVLRRIINAAASNSAGLTEITRAVREAVDAAQRHAMPVVRTAVTAVLGAAMVASVRENGRTVRGWVHVSCLDSRTTETCKKRSGARFLADGTPVGHSLPFRVPPLHMGCRSHLAPWFHSMGEMPQATAGAIVASGRERAFRDKTPRDLDLGEWLATRPVKDQEAAIGKARIDAWRAGKITTPALLDQSSRPLTLEQIRQRLGL